MRDGGTRRPVFCSKCGEALVERSEPLPDRFDAFTGERVSYPPRIKLECKHRGGHDRWGEVDGRWYRLLPT